MLSSRSPTPRQRGTSGDFAAHKSHIRNVTFEEFLKTGIVESLPKNVSELTPTSPEFEKQSPPTFEDLDTLSRDELIALARTQRERIAELEQRGRLDEREDLADSLPELPPELANAKLIQMGALWDDYDKVVAEVQAGTVFILTSGDVPRARIEALQERAATSVKRRELFRRRGEWLKRLDEGEAIAPEESGMIMLPLSVDQAVAVSHSSLDEWHPRSERRTPAQRRREREKMRRYHDSKRTSEELKRLQELREERARTGRNPIRRT